MNRGIHHLRGICAIIVYLGHVLGMMPNIIFEKTQPTIWHILYDGQCAVYVFFAITGFFLYSENAISVKSFLFGLAKKSKKILPPHIVVLVFALICCNLHIEYNHELFTDWSNHFWVNDVGYVEFFKQALILPPHDPDLLNPPTWYLISLAKALIILPWLIMFLNRTTWYLLLIVLIFPLFYEFAIITSLLPFLIASCMRKNLMLISRILDKTKVQYLLFCLSLFLLNIRNEFNGIENFYYTLSQSFGASCIVTICYYRNSYIKNRILDWLGDISYPFYLVHFVLLLALKPFVDDIVMLFIMSLLLSLTMAHILHYYIFKQ